MANERCQICCDDEYTTERYGERRVCAACAIGYACNAADFEEVYRRAVAEALRKGPRGLGLTRVR